VFIIQERFYYIIITMVNLSNVIRDSSILDRLTGRELAQLRTTSKEMREHIDSRPNLTRKVEAKKAHYKKLENTLERISRKEHVGLKRKNISYGKLLRHKLGGIYQEGPTNYMAKVPGSRQYGITEYMREIDHAVSVIDRLRHAQKSNIEVDEDGTVYFTVNGKDYLITRSGFLRIPNALGISGVRVGDIFTRTQMNRLFVIDRLRHAQKTNIEVVEDGTISFTVNGQNYLLTRSGFLRIPNAPGISGVRVGDIFTQMNGLFA